MTFFRTFVELFNYDETLREEIEERADIQFDSYPIGKNGMGIELHFEEEWTTEQYEGYISDTVEAWIAQCPKVRVNLMLSSTQLDDTYQNQTFNGHELVLMTVAHREALAKDQVNKYAY